MKLHYFIKINKTKGFTLIELLVVITIIGMLASILMSSLGESRKKARDTRRKVDLIQVRTALFLYQDSYGVFPPVTDDRGDGWDDTANTIFIPQLITTGYINAYPQDPLNSIHGYWYTSNIVPIISTGCPLGTRAVLKYYPETTQYNANYISCFGIGQCLCVL